MRPSDEQAARHAADCSPVQFAILSLFAVGGVMAVIPEMHRQAVEVSHWMTERQFADLFAIAQAAPGPNIIIVTLIGFQVAGFAGAIVATLCDVRAGLRAHVLRGPCVRPVPATRAGAS